MKRCFFLFFFFLFFFFGSFFEISSHEINFNHVRYDPNFIADVKKQMNKTLPTGDVFNLKITEKDIFIYKQEYDYSNFLDLLLMLLRFDDDYNGNAENEDIEAHLHYYHPLVTCENGIEKVYLFLSKHTTYLSKDHFDRIEFSKQTNGEISIYICLNEEYASYIIKEGIQNNSEWNELLRTVNGFYVQEPLNITTSDILSKIWGVKKVEGSFWNVDFTGIFNEINSYPCWRGGGSYHSPQPIYYLNKKIDSFDKTDKGETVTPYAYSYWFDFSSTKECKEFVNKIIADFEANNVKLRKLNCKKHNIKNVWAAIHKDLFIEIMADFRKDYPQLWINIHPKDGEIHNNWKITNKFLCL